MTKLTWTLLILAGLCLVASLVFTITIGKQVANADWISFALMSGYVVLMLAFLFIVGRRRDREATAEEGDGDGQPPTA
jgi:hypothetical protein